MALISIPWKEFLLSTQTIPNFSTQCKCGLPPPWASHVSPYTLPLPLEYAWSDLPKHEACAAVTPLSLLDQLNHLPVSLQVCERVHPWEPRITVALIAYSWPQIGQQQTPTVECHSGSYWRFITYYCSKRWLTHHLIIKINIRWQWQRGLPRLAVEK